MLTEGGHPNAWDYTPREFLAYLTLAQRRKRLNLSERLFVQAMAARGDEKAIDRLRKQWGKDGW